MDSVKVRTSPYPPETLKTFYRMLLMSHGPTYDITLTSTLEGIVNKDPELKAHVIKLTEDNKAKQGIFYWEVLHYLAQEKQKLEKGEPKVENSKKGSSRNDHPQPERTHT